MEAAAVLEPGRDGGSADRPPIRTRWIVLLVVIVGALAATVFVWLSVTGFNQEALLVLATLVLAFVALVGSVVSWLVGTNQIRESRIAGRAQFFASGIPILNDFRNKLESEEFKEVRKVAAQHMLDGKVCPQMCERKDCPEIQALLNEYESIGILVEKGGLDEDLVYNYFSDWVLHVYWAVEDILVQETGENPLYWENFRKLHKRMVAIEERKGGKPRPTRGEVTRYLQNAASWKPSPVSVAERYQIIPINDLVQLLRPVLTEVTQSDTPSNKNKN